MSKDVELKVEAYIRKHTKWSNGLVKLIKILDKTELEPSIKWGVPVYHLDNKNVVGITAFKNHFSFWFYQGVFLKDEYSLLVNAQEGKTKAMRHLRFENVEDINVKITSAYIKEAIQNQKDGKVLKSTKSSSTFKMAPELAERLKKNKSLRASFDKLTKYRQKEFSEYISEAKREETKKRRLKKILPLIKEGKPIY